MVQGLCTSSHMHRQKDVLGGGGGREGGTEGEGGREREDSCISVCVRERVCVSKRERERER